MNKAVSFFLSIGMLLPMCACASTSSQTGQNESPMVQTQQAEDSSVPENAEDTPATGEQETYLLRIANTNNENSYSGDLTKKLFDQVAAESNGRVIPEYYFSGSLGDKTACMEGMRANTIQVADLAATDLAVYDTGWSVFALPYLFGGDTAAELACYQDEEFFSFLDESLQKSGFKLLLFYTTGYRNKMNTKRQVHTPEDAQGIRIRVLQNTYLAQSFELMGFSPVSLGWSEVYSALQQGTIDGAEQSAALLLDNQLADYGKYLTTLDAISICGTFVMSLDSYNSLPQDVQQILDESCREIMAWEWEDFQNYEAESLQALIDKGVTVTELTPEEKQVFIDRIAGIKDNMFAEEPETETFYNEIQAALERTQ